MSIKIEVNTTSSFCYFLISKLLLKHQYRWCSCIVEREKISPKVIVNPMDVLYKSD